MKQLVLLYVGTCILASLSQQYYPAGSCQDSKRHFMRDQMDVFTILIVIWMTLFSGLRTSYNDTNNYIGYFREAATTLSEQFATSTETGLADNPLYYITQVLVKGIVDNYHVWFLLTAFVSCYVAVKFIRHYSTSFAWSILLFNAIGTYVMYIAAIKQSIAVAILMCAIPMAIRKKWGTYYALVILAMLFHTHAFLFLIMPVLLSKPWGKITWGFVAATIFAMLTYGRTLGAFMEYAQSIGANVAEVEVFDGHSVNMLRIAVYGIFPILALIFRKRLFRDSSETEDMFVNMTILSWLILMIGTVEGGNLFARMAGYFEWTVGLSSGMIIKKLFTKNSQRIVFLSAAVLYTVYFLYEFGVSKGFGNGYRAITLWQFIQSLFQ